MSSYRLSFLALLLLLIVSCKDTKTHTEATENTATKALIQDSIPDIETIQERRARYEAAIPEIDKLEQEELIPFLTQYGKENPETRVRITCEFGTIDLELYKDTPLHRANFIRLVKLGYFNTTFFHRVSPGFVVQGGNSDRTDTAKMRGKIGSYLIPSEFVSGHTHNRGALGAAKYAEQNVSKASSPFEFYIVQKKNGSHHIDRDHTVFGKVTSGMDVIDKINGVEIDDSEWPRKNIPIEIDIVE